MKKIILVLCAFAVVFGLYGYIKNFSDFNVVDLYSSNDVTLVVERFENRKFDDAPSFDNIAFEYEEEINAIKEGFDNQSRSINIYQYKITVDELNSIVDYLCANGGYYYVDGSYNYFEDGQYVRSLVPKYLFDSQTVINNQKAIDAEIEKIAQNALQFETDIEKLIYVHDYLVDNVQYDEGNNENNNIYGALVLKDTMCMGYSQAFCSLVQKLGYKAYVVSSNELEHAWNMILLNGSYYFVDCTWDDPVFSEISLSANPLSGYGCYKYFMCSEDMFYEDHASSDWNVNGESIMGAAKSDIYDDAFWHDYESLLKYSNGSWFHDYGYGDKNVYSINDVKFSIDRINFLSNIEIDIKIVRTINACWQTGTHYYLGFESTLQTYDNEVYYMTENGIYKLAESGRFNGKDDELVFENNTDDNIFDFDIDAESGTFKVMYGATDEYTEKNSSEIKYNIADYF